MYSKYLSIFVISIFCITGGIAVGWFLKPSYYYLVEYHTGDPSPAYAKILSKTQCKNLASDINDAADAYIKKHPDEHDYILYAWCIP
jgi:hypothetical protein